MQSPAWTRHPEVLIVEWIYCDLIFSGLAGMPALGEETRTQQFTMTAGGGAFNTASGLARLRVRTGLLAYAGKDLLGRLRSEGTTTSLDIGWNPALYDSPEFREVVLRVKAYERLTADAAAARSWRAAVAARATHSLVPSFEIASQIAEEYRRLHSPYLAYLS